jgi:hypothetical protein
VPCHRLIGHFENRLGEGKFKDNLALIIGYFERGIQKPVLHPLGLQYFPDHRPRDLPCTIGIAQFFAFGISHQFVADPGVEKISWHGLRPAFCLGGTAVVRIAHKLLFKVNEALSNQPPPGMRGDQS